MISPPQTIEVVMNDKDMDAFVFGIFPKKKFLGFKNAQYDLVRFCYLRIVCSFSSSSQALF